MLRTLTATLVIVATLQTCGELCAQSHIHILSAYRLQIDNAQVRILDDNELLPQDDSGPFVLPQSYAGQDTQIEVSAPGYITRTAGLDPTHFNQGFAVTLWTRGDLNNVENIVVNNPNEIAVVLAFDSRLMTRPMVMAKGFGAEAVQIRQSARCARSVTLPPLARALYAQAQVGLEVPEQLNVAVIQLFNDPRIVSTPLTPPNEVDTPQTFPSPPEDRFRTPWGGSDAWTHPHPIRIGAPVKRHIFSIIRHLNPTSICGG